MNVYIFPCAWIFISTNISVGAIGDRFKVTRVPLNLKHDRKHKITTKKQNTEITFHFETGSNITPMTDIPQVCFYWCTWPCDVIMCGWQAHWTDNRLRQFPIIVTAFFISRSDSKIVLHLCHISCVCKLVISLRHHFGPEQWFQILWFLKKKWKKSYQRSVQQYTDLVQLVSNILLWVNKIERDHFVPLKTNGLKGKAQIKRTTIYLIQF